jgi:hypothetical protein
MHVLGSIISHLSMAQTHCEVSIGTAALCDRLADLVDEVVLALHSIGNGARGRLDRLLFELDRHGALNRMRRALFGCWARPARCCSDREVETGQMGAAALVFTLQDEVDGWGRQHASAQSALAPGLMAVWCGIRRRCRDLTQQQPPRPVA